MSDYIYKPKSILINHLNNMNQNRRKKNEKKVFGNYQSTTKNEKAI